MGNFAENLNLGNRFRPPPAGEFIVSTRVCNFGKSLLSCLLYELQKPIRMSIILSGITFCKYFILINMYCTSMLLNTILFADNTRVFYSHKNLPVLCDIMSNKLKEICNWFKANKVSLNEKKTNLMFMGTSKLTSSIDNENVNIYLDGCKLSRVHDAKFLGVLNKVKLFFT